MPCWPRRDFNHDHPAGSQNWQDYQNLAGPAMTDPNVAADVGIVADHNYDGANGPTTLTKSSYGKALWKPKSPCFQAAMAALPTASIMPSGYTCS